MARRPQFLPGVLTAALCGGSELGQVFPADFTCSGQRGAVSGIRLLQEHPVASSAITLMLPCDTVCSAIPSVLKGKAGRQTFSSHTRARSTLVLFAFFPSVINYVPCRSQEPWISVLEWLLISPGFIRQLPSSNHVGPSVAPHTSCPWIFAQAVPLTPNASTLPPITWLPLLHISVHASPPQEGLPGRPLTVPQTGTP